MRSPLLSIVLLVLFSYSSSNIVNQLRLPPEARNQKLETRLRQGYGGQARNNPTTCGPKSEGGGTGGERRQGGWAPPRSGRGGGCGCGAARDDSIVPHPRRRRPSVRTAATSALPPVPKRALPRRRPRARPWNASDFREQARRTAQGARTAKRPGVKAIWRLPNPRDARRNARPPPCRRAPEIGRRGTTHGTELRAWSLEFLACPPTCPP